MLSVDGYDNKVKVGKQLLKEKIEYYDSNTFLKHLNDKLKNTWSDGTYFSKDKLRRQPVAPDNIIYKTIFQNENNIYKYIPQVMHLSMLIFITINSINILINKKFSSKDFILIIMMFGLMIFLLFWETRSRYLITLLPLMMILQINGIDVLCKRY